MHDIVHIHTRTCIRMWRMVTRKLYIALMHNIIFYHNINLRVQCKNPISPLLAQMGLTAKMYCPIIKLSKHVTQCVDLIPFQILVISVSIWYGCIKCHFNKPQSVYILIGFLPSIILFQAKIEWSAIQWYAELYSKTIMTHTAVTELKKPLIIVGLISTSF